MRRFCPVVLLDIIVAVSLKSAVVDAVFVLIKKTTYIKETVLCRGTISQIAHLIPNSGVSDIACMFFYFEISVWGKEWEDFSIAWAICINSSNSDKMAFDESFS